MSVKHDKNNLFTKTDELKSRTIIEYFQIFNF